MLSMNFASSFFLFFFFLFFSQRVIEGFAITSVLVLENFCIFILNL